MAAAIFIKQSTTGLWVAVANFSKEFAQGQGLQVLSSVNNPHRVRMTIAIFSRQFTYCIQVAIAIFRRWPTHDGYGICYLHWAIYTGLGMAVATFSSRIHARTGVQLLSSVAIPHRVRVAITIVSRESTHCLEVTIAIFSRRSTQTG